MTGCALICCVVNMGDASKVLKSARKYGVDYGMISLGRGTIHNRLLDFLHINEVRKEVVTMLVDDGSALAALKGIGADMGFHKPHHGIAFMFSVSERLGGKVGGEGDAAVSERVAVNGHTTLSDSAAVSENTAVSESTAVSEVKDGVYNIIYVVVDKGKAEYVVDAANKAGARGGTIINARGAGTDEVRKVFSVEIEPEKEEVFIITKKDGKDAIVESIRQHVNIDEPGGGILFVLDVSEVYGLHEG